MGRQAQPCQSCLTHGGQFNSSPGWHPTTQALPGELLPMVGAEHAPAGSMLAPQHCLCNRLEASSGSSPAHGVGDQDPEGLTSSHTVLTLHLNATSSCVFPQQPSPLSCSRAGQQNTCPPSSQSDSTRGTRHPTTAPTA